MHSKTKLLVISYAFLAFGFIDAFVASRYSTHGNTIGTIILSLGAICGIAIGLYGLQKSTKKSG